MMFLTFLEFCVYSTTFGNSLLLYANINEDTLLCLLFISSYLIFALLLIIFLCRIYIVIVFNLNFFAIFLMFNLILIVEILYALIIHTM